MVGAGLATMKPCVIVRLPCSLRGDRALSALSNHVRAMLHDDPPCTAWGSTQRAAIVILVAGVAGNQTEESVTEEIVSRLSAVNCSVESTQEVCSKAKSGTLGGGIALSTVSESDLNDAAVSIGSALRNSDYDLRSIHFITSPPAYTAEGDAAADGGCELIASCSSVVSNTIAIVRYATTRELAHFPRFGATAKQLSAESVGAISKLNAPLHIVSWTSLAQSEALERSTVLCEYEYCHMPRSVVRVDALHVNASFKDYATLASFLSSLNRGSAPSRARVQGLSVSVTLAQEAGEAALQFAKSTQEVEMQCKACTLVQLIALRKFRLGGVEVLGLERMPYGVTFAVAGEHVGKAVNAVHEAVLDQSQASMFSTLACASSVEAESSAEVEMAFECAWWRSGKEKLLQAFEESGQRSAYVYHLDGIRKRAGELKTLEPVVQKFFYAMKANSNKRVLQTLHTCGIGFECVSPGELRFLFELIPDVKPENVLFTPNFAPREDYEYALSLGVNVTVDNLSALEEWDSTFRGKEICVRMDPGVGRGHHKHVKTAGKMSKFGISTSDIPELVRISNQIDCTVSGLHCHVGSGILDSTAWCETGRYLASLCQHFPKLRFCDLGGGLGVVEKPEQIPLDMAALREALHPIAQLVPNVELWMEPGRFLVAESGVLLSRVTQVKQKEQAQYVGLSTGFNSLIRPTMYGSYHYVINLTRVDCGAPMHTASVVGPICETGDIFAVRGGRGVRVLLVLIVEQRSRRIHVSSVDDVFLIATAGAYGHTMSMAYYNMRPAAAELVIDAI